ncbi:MAG: NAD+ synthase [Terrimicrobiaceae bacterium]
MKIGFAQVNTTVGDFAGNISKIAAAYQSLVAAGASVVLTPELAITGYPPQDLVFQSRFVPANLEALDRLASLVGSTPLVVGFVDTHRGPSGRPFRNSAAVLQSGRILATAAKSLLPTYDVFDEARYFEPATEPTLVHIDGIPCGITICEDIWTPEHLPGPLYSRDPLAELVARGARCILNLSASPFEVGKPSQRRTMLAGRSAAHNIPIAYCNSVGGNDQLIFDGHSLAIGPEGCLWQGAGFDEEIACIDWAFPGSPVDSSSDLHDLHRALVLGIRDYFRKCGFSSAVLGLSGGIDSALTACLAADALGPERVTGVLMPSPYSSDHSVQDAEALASHLGISTWKIPIERSFEAVKAQLSDAFRGRQEDTTEENLQARLRGITLMALSNKFGSLLLTTGNKSELAVGYCTLYGDMCGGLAAISDVPKTTVYALSHHINEAAGREIIPARTITKPPSAELRPNQTDQDTLPPYDLLDSILAAYVEENLSAPEIISRGLPAETVRWVLRRVDLNEYKRAQAAPGLKVSPRAFGFGRRIPIAQKFVC